MENNTQQRTELAQKINQQLEELVKGVDKHQDFLNKLSNAAERFSNLDDQLDALTSDSGQHAKDISDLQNSLSLLKNKYSTSSKQLSKVLNEVSSLNGQLNNLASGLKQYQSDYSGLQQEFSSFCQAQNEQREVLVNQIRNEKRLHPLIIAAIILSVMSLGLSVTSLLL